MNDRKRQASGICLDRGKQLSYPPGVDVTFDQEFQRAVDDPRAMRELVKQGLTLDWFSRLAALFGIPASAFAALVGMDARTLSRRRREGKLTAKESNALYNLLVLYGHALDVLGDPEMVRNWFSTPAPALGDVPPRELLDTTPGIKEIDRLLGRIEHGVF